MYSSPRRWCNLRFSYTQDRRELLLRLSSPLFSRLLRIAARLARVLVLRWLSVESTLLRLTLAPYWSHHRLRAEVRKLRAPSGVASSCAHDSSDSADFAKSILPLVRIRVSAACVQGDPILGALREAGAIPARSRRCNRGRTSQHHCPTGWEGARGGRSESQKTYPGLITSFSRGREPMARLESRNQCLCRRYEHGRDIGIWLKKSPKPAIAWRLLRSSFC